MESAQSKLVIGAASRNSLDRTDMTLHRNHARDGVRPRRAGRGAATRARVPLYPVMIKIMYTRLSRA